MCACTCVCTPVPGGEAADRLKADPPGQIPGPSRVVCAQGQTGPRGLAKKVIGPSVFWFEAKFAEGKDLYISLDSATGTLGSKQTKWFKSFLSENRAKYRHCVILTHTNFFYTDNSQTGSGNMPFEESLALIDFLGKQNVSLVLQGHDHSREDLMYDNVRYVILGAIHDKADAPEYLKIDVNNEGLTLSYKMIP